VGKEHLGESYNLGARRELHGFWQSGNNLGGTIDFIDNPRWDLHAGRKNHNTEGGGEKREEGKIHRIPGTKGIEEIAGKTEGRPEKAKGEGGRGIKVDLEQRLKSLLGPPLEINRFGRLEREGKEG